LIASSSHEECIRLDGAIGERYRDGPIGAILRPGAQGGDADASANALVYLYGIGSGWIVRLRVAVRPVLRTFAQLLRSWLPRSLRERSAGLLFTASE
jgi:hypothetical protein